MNTYAAIDNDNRVFDIVEFDVLSGESIPHPGVTLVKVADTIPTIGQIWNGEIFE